MCLTIPFLLGRFYYRYIPFTNIQVVDAGAYEKRASYFVVDFYVGGKGVADQNEICNTVFCPLYELMVCI